MPTITVALPSERLVKLNEVARQLGVVPEEPVLVSIEELLTRREAGFEQVVQQPGEYSCVQTEAVPSGPPAS